MVDLVNGVSAVPVALSSGSNVDFIVENWRYLDLYTTD